MSTADAVREARRRNVDARVHIADVATRVATRAGLSRTALTPVTDVLDSVHEREFNPEHYTAAGFTHLVAESDASHATAVANARLAAIELAGRHGTRGSQVLDQFLDEAGLSPVTEVTHITATGTVTWEQPDADNGTGAEALGSVLTEAFGPSAKFDGTVTARRVRA